MPYLKKSNLGYTLTELIIVMATSGLLLGAVVSSFITQQNSYDLQAQIVEMTHNARTAIDRITRELRTAGYGVPESGLSNWVDWLKDEDGKPITLTSPIQIIPRKSGQNMLMLTGCFDPPIATVKGLPLPLVTQELDLRHAQKHTRDKLKSGNVLYIGRNENAKITSVKSRPQHSNRIGIDTNPNKAGRQGLSGIYLDTLIDQLPVELLDVITYKIDRDHENDSVPTLVLRRDKNTGGGAQPLAEHIETLSLTQHDDLITVSLTARTPEPDPKYRHPTAHDGYRRLTLSSTVRLRNIGSTQNWLSMDPLDNLIQSAP